jgi:NitT/TauT family transport system permease protein
MPVLSSGLTWVRRLLPFALGAIVITVWWWMTRDGGGFMRATPSEVVAAYNTMIADGSLTQHVLTTLAEVALGYFMGVSLAFVLGYSVSRMQSIEKLVLPYLVGLQAIPIVAIAPIIITYLGPGLITNGLICALIVFFPMLITTNVAIRTIDHDKREFMRLMSATWWQTFIKLEIPAALPVIFGGLKVSTTLAVIGAVVGEGVSAEHGLGFLVYYSRYVFNQSSTLVGLFTLMIVAYSLYWLVSLIERKLLRWQR